MGFEPLQTGIIVCHVKTAPPHISRFYIGRKYGRFEASPPDYAGLYPISMRFSKLVGDILKEVIGEAEAKYKYYM
jgi:hypothetical protein